MKKSFCDHCVVEIVKVPVKDVKRTIKGQIYLIELHVYLCGTLNSVEGPEAELCSRCLSDIVTEALT